MTAPVKRHLDYKTLLRAGIWRQQIAAAVIMQNPFSNIHEDDNFAIIELEQQGPERVESLPREARLR